MRKFKQSSIALCIQAVVAAGSLMATQAMSAEEAPQAEVKGLEVIEVTARKRVETVKDVPATVTAISEDTIKDYLGSGENIRALAGRVPSLQIESSNGRQSPRFYIRGLGNTDFDVNANQPVSMVMDEIVLENSVLKGLPIFDISRVEVLNGPQGTLFGRNTTAGIVKIDTTAPEFNNEGYARAGYGSRGTTFIEGAMNVELSDKWASRISIKRQDRDAWIDNPIRDEEVGGYKELAYRLQFLYESGEDTRALFKLHGFNQDGDTPQIFYANAIQLGTEGVRSGFDESVIYHDSSSGFYMDHVGGSLKVEHSFDDIDFTSVTGYDTLESWSFADIDGGVTSFPPEASVNELGKQLFFNVASGDGLSDHSQFTQEFRISGEANDLYYQVGVFFFKEDYTVDNKDLDIDGSTINFYQIDQLTTSQALFGQIEYKPLDELAVTLGLRYTSDDKELDIREGGTSNILFEIDKDDSYVNWDLAARYTFNKDWTGFARIGNASRGPVTIGRFGFPSEADTETLTSYEIGLKADLFEGNARWNLTAYTYDIEDHQLTATGGEANTNSLLNADNTFGAGVETSLEAMLTDDLRLNFNLSYNKTEIQDESLKAELCSSTPNCNSSDTVANVVDGAFGPVTTVFVDGNPLPRAPEWLSNISLNYEIPLGDSGYGYAQTDWNYRSESNIFLYESTEFVAEARWIGGVRIGYKTDDGLDIALVGRNITNEIVVDGALDFLNLTAFVNEPRFWGIEAQIGF